MIKASKTPIEYALGLLSQRPYTEHQIREKLTKKFTHQEFDLDPIITRLEELNYINDEDFTDRWIRYRSADNPKGKFALRNELKSKGINSALIERKVHHLNEGPLVKQLIESRFPKIKAKDQYDRKRKLIRFLLSRGFSMSTVIEEVENFIGEHSG